MNLYLLTFFWISFALLLLSIILPATLVTPGPNLGSLVPAQFYGSVGGEQWVIPITPSCVVLPSNNFSGIRGLSNNFFAPGWRSPLNEKPLSNLAWAFGQLVMEDIVVLRPNGAAPPIVIPLETGVNVTMQVIPVVTRSGIGNTTNAWGCPEVPNNVSALLDCSWLYGDSVLEAAVLREGVNGRLRMSTGGRLPINSMTGQFIAGNSALANENALVSALMNLFLLEHNHWANELRTLNPGLSDDILFYKARSFVIAEYQAIVWNEWIPFMFPIFYPQVPSHTTTAAAAAVTMEFALLGTQFYKTMINGDTTVYGNTTQQILQQGTTSTLLGGWQSTARKFDSFVADTLANNSISYDYISEILALSQQVGLAPYLDIRTRYGNYQCISDISRWSVPLAAFFNESTTSFNSLSALGCGTTLILSDQLRRSAAADPYWFTLPHMNRYLSPTWYNSLVETRLSDILTRNLPISPTAGAPTDSAFIKRI